MSSGGLKKIGKYDVEDILGRGGMGVVYKAVDPALDRPVAIKMMTASYSEDPDLLKRFYREAQFTGNLHHPNIVTVYDLGDLDGAPYFVMEFLEGESLDSIISSGKDVSLLQKVDYIIQVCTGLEYAHQQRVIHRDIKPGNVMVLRNDSVKIVDFGIARLGNDRLTRPRQVMGSYHYMSPEQINDKEIDARTDIFSTGVVLFQLLTRRLPFEAEDVVSTLMKVISSPTPPLSNFLSGYPPELDEIIGRALQKNKEDRYQSAEEFSFELLQVAEKLKKDAIAAILVNAEGLFEKGELTAARHEALQALRLDRQSTQANDVMRRIQQTVLKRQRAEEAKILVKKAEEALSNRDFARALQSLEQAKALDPSDGDLGKLVEIVNTLKDRGDRLRAAMRTAASARAAGRLDEAQAATDEALSIEPENPQALKLAEAISLDLQERKLEELLNEARDEIAHGLFREALDVLGKARELNIESPALIELSERAESGIEQEHRRQERERIITEIEGALARHEYEAACASANEALQHFSSDPVLLELKQSAERHKAEKERQEWVQEKLDAAQRLLEKGKTSEALKVLQSASQRHPDESTLQSAVAAIEETLAREAAERRRQEFLRNAKDLMRRRAYEEAIQLLTSASDEYSSREVDELLHSAREGLANHQRELKVEALTAEAWRHLDIEEYEQAIGVLENGVREIPSEPLNILLAEAKRRFSDFNKGVQDAINNSQRLLALEKAEQALSMLQSQPRAYSRVPAFASAVEDARKMKAHLRAIDGARQQVWTLLANGNLDKASELLRESRDQFGPRIEFDQLAHEIEAEGVRLQVREFETEVAEAEMLVRMGSYEAALRTLDGISGTLPSVPAQLSSRYESVRGLSTAGIEKRVREVEERERAKAEALERERKERERRQAEEKARKESEARARKEAEEKERRAREAAEALSRERANAEKRERERQAKERREAEERARQEAARQQEILKARQEEERQRKELEKRIRDQAQKGRDRDAGSEPTIPYRGGQPPFPPSGGRRAGDQEHVPILRKKESEPTVAELTPPEGVVLPGTTTVWHVGATAPPVESSPSELSQVIPNSEIQSLPIETEQGVIVGSPPTRAGGLPKTLIAAAAMVLVAGGAVAIWLRPHQATRAVDVDFATSPPGAQLKVNDQTCVSPCRMSLPEGDYVVDAEMNGAKAEKPFSANKRQGSQTVALTLPPPSEQPNAVSLGKPSAAVSTSTGTLVVHTNVDDASVLVDDKLLGKTSGGSVRIPLEPKRYKVRVEKEGFESSRPQTATVRTGTDASTSFELKASKASPPASESKVAQAQSPQNSAQKPAEAPQSPPQVPQQPQTPPPQIAVSTQPPPKPVDDGSQLWSSIGGSNRKSDFEDFRSKFPNSPHADQAAKKIEQLDWEEARGKKDENAIQAFLTKYPNGGFADAARREIERLHSQQQSGERQAVITVLKRFESSYNERNADQLASIWPSLPKQELKKIRESFKQADAVHMHLEYAPPAIAGNQATVTCQRSVQFVFKEGTQPERTDHVTIQLHKTDTGWQMDSVR